MVGDDNDDFCDECTMASNWSFTYSRQEEFQLFHRLNENLTLKTSEFSV